MSLQPRWQMIQLMALLAFTAAAWMIAAAASAAKPSEAIIASADTEVATDAADAGVEPEAEVAPAARPAGAKAEAKAEAKKAAAPEPPKFAVYTVQPGDSLSEIADAHGVPLADLIAANAIANPDALNAGVELKIPGAVAAAPKKAAPEGVRITVPKGVTLSRIAEVYGIPWKRIAKANDLKNGGRVRAGQRLFIPGATKVLEIVPCLKPPVELYRVRSDDAVKVSLCRCNGEANPAGVEALSALASPPNDPPPFPLDDRLAQLLQKVADRYPGKRIELISGYRPRKHAQKAESLHNKGRALDFRVEGVANSRLVGLVKAFDRVGVGYYPNSVFIHLDSREKSGYWIDYSRPGEKAIYGRAGMTADEIEKIRLARREAAAAAKAVDVQFDAEAQADAEAGDEVAAEPGQKPVDAETLARMVQAAVAEALADPAADPPAPTDAPAAADDAAPIAANVASDR